MALNNNARNPMLNALTGSILYVSLHTADPGTTGTNEATGGSPAYARKAVTWTSSTVSVLNASNTPTFDVPAGTFTHGGFWSAVTGGTFYGGGALNAPVTFAAQGTYTLSATSITQA